MKKDKMMHVVGIAVWIITSLAAINVGLSVMMGWNFFATDFMMMNMPQLIRPMHLLIGLAGVISFAMCVMALMCKCGKCEMCKGRK